MRALTLRQPWAYAVTHLGKRVENRTQRPPAALVGQRIAIHAGLTDDWEGGVSIEMRGLGSISAPIGPIVKGAIVATARIAGWYGVGSPDTAKVEPELTGAEVDPSEVFDIPHSPWFVGPVGILLADVVVLREPVPARGMQGYWPVPADVERRVLEQLSTKRGG